MIQITYHFRHRWVDRVGTRCPTEKELQRLLDQSTVVQRGLTILDKDGYPIKVLSCYLLDARGVVVKVDPERNRAVTVLVPGMWQRD